MPPGQHIRTLLLAGMAGLFLARHPVAGLEALDRAVTEPHPAPGKRTAKLLDGGVGGLADQFEDQVAMRLDVARSAVPAQRSRPRIAL